MKNIFKILLAVLMIVSASELQSQADPNDPFGIRFNSVEENEPNNQMQPLNVLPSFGRFLGRIAPGTQRILTNPETYSLIFTISGEIDAYVSVNAVINNDIDGVLLESFIWEEYSYMNGFQPIGLSTYDGSFTNYQTQLQKVNSPNNVGVTQLRVYPQQLKAQPNAATMKEINFTVTLTVTYTGI